MYGAPPTHMYFSQHLDYHTRTFTSFENEDVCILAAFVTNLRLQNVAYLFHGITPT